MAIPDAPLDAGSIVVRYRLDKDERSFRAYKAELAALIRDTEAADRRLSLNPRIDRGARQSAREWFDGLGRDMDRVEKKWEQTSDQIAKTPLQPEIDRRSVARFESTLKGMERSVRRTSRSITSALKFGTYVGGGAAAGIGAAFVGAGMEYAKFEDQLYKVQAISGATAKQMDRLRRAAKNLATEGRYSQQELGAAQVELVKGGMEAADLYGGGLRTAYLLASAGQIELADAAMYTVNAMNLFNISGKDATRIADGFAAAANITTASVDDFGMALTQGGAAAKVAGLSFEDTMVWLEALAKMGIKNSDAGTSLKSAIIQATAGLSPRAREIMKVIGLDLFNAKGELKEITEITKELVTSVGEYDRESQINILGQIFGSDGVRAAIALLEQGTDGVDRLGKQTRKQGEAARVTSIQNQGLAFAYQQLKNTIGVVAAEAFAPFDKNVTGAFNNLQKWLKSSIPEVRAFSERVNKILDTDMSWKEKASAIWTELANSEAAQLLKDAVVQVLSAVPPIVGKVMVETLKAIPQIIYKAWTESGFLGKATLVAILTAKFAPAALAVGGLFLSAIGGALRGIGKIPGIGKLLGKIPGLGKVASGVSGSVVPVFVTNWGGAPGMPGAPGGKGGKGGLPSRAGRWMARGLGFVGLGLGGTSTLSTGAAIPGLGVVGAGGIAGLVAPAAAVAAAVIGGGYLATKLSGQGPLSKKADPKAARAFSRQMYEAKARNFMNERDDLLEGDPRTRAKRIKQAMSEELANVPKAMRGAWAKSALIWVREMENAKRLSRGTAAQVKKHLVGSMKVISRETARAAMGYGLSVSQMAAKTRQLARDAERAGVSVAQLNAAVKARARQAGKAADTAAGAIQGIFASGAYVGGSSSTGVPVIVHGDEAILNSRQMDMIGRDRIMAVLGATGAQTITAGGSYAKGGKPEKGAGSKRAPAALLDQSVKKDQAEAERKRREAARKRAEARANPTVPGLPKFEDELRKLELDRARAEDTTDFNDATTKDLVDDRRVLTRLRALYDRRISKLNSLAPKYKMKGKGAWPQMRREIDDELTARIRERGQIKADLKSIENQIKPMKDPNDQDLTAPQDTGIERLQQDILIREARGGLGMTPQERESLLAQLDAKLTWLQDKLKKSAGPKLKELRDRINAEINQTAGEMKSLRDSTSDISRPTAATAAYQFSQARTDLFREFGSNSRAMPIGGQFAGFGSGLAGSGGGARGGTMVTQNITIAQPPPDPHAFSRSLAFEIRGAL